jgi:hypothetical protein
MLVKSLPNYLALEIDRFYIATPPLSVDELDWFLVAAAI